MAGEIIKTPVPLAVFFLTTIGMCLTAKGVGEGSNPTIAIGCVLTGLGLYHAVNYFRIRSKDRR